MEHRRRLKNKMVKIVKNIREAEIGNLLSSSGTKQNSSDLGKIISDVKEIVKGVQDLRGQPQQVKVEPPQLPKEENKEIPVAVLKIDDKEVDNFLAKDLKELLNAPSVNQEITLKELIENWSNLKELIKPEVKKVITKLAKAKLEYR